MCIRDRLESGADAHPIWCRYWQHNTGAHPTGYLPVVITVEGNMPIENSGGQFPTVGNFRVRIVNNYTDRRIEGVARIVTPDRWRVMPAEIPYSIEPRGRIVREVVVAFDRNPRTGLLKARLEHDGRVYQDVLEVGYGMREEPWGGEETESTVRRDNMRIVKERPVRWKVVRDGTDVLVRVFNPWLEPLEAEVTLVSPVEMWGAQADGYAVGNVAPAAHAITIPGRRETVLRFSVDGNMRPAESFGHGPTWWGWAKITYNGTREYLPVPGTTA